MTPTLTYPEVTITWPESKYIVGIESPVKRICVDIDGVICEYDFPRIVKNFFGIDLSSKAIFAYDLADVLGVDPILINLMFKEQVFGKPNLIYGAVDTLKLWQGKGYEIVIFSSRIKYMGLNGLVSWLDAYKIPFDRIDGGLDNYKAHIDDRPSKLMSTDSQIKLLYNRPWNENCHNITGRLKRVYNWSEINSQIP